GGDADLRHDRRGQGVDKRALQDGRVTGLLPAQRQVHPVAAAAARHVGAGRYDAIERRRDHPEQPALRGHEPEGDLALDHIRRGSGRREPHEPAVELADASAPCGEALDPQGGDLALLPHFVIVTRCAATWPASTVTEITLVCVPLFRVSRCWPGLTLT